MIPIERIGIKQDPSTCDYPCTSHLKGSNLIDQNHLATGETLHIKRVSFDFLFIPRVLLVMILLGKSLGVGGELYHFAFKYMYHLDNNASIVI